MRSNPQRLVYIGTIALLILYASAVALLLLSCSGCAVATRLNDGGGFRPNDPKLPPSRFS
jgi:hypothetical protein